MSFKAIVYQVMIASPGDVSSERSIIREILYEWNVINSDTSDVVLLPVGWETHSSPEMGDKPQTIINKQILKNCDLLVGVFWTRIGTSTEEYASGTVEEIEEHIKAGKPAMLYFSSAPVHPDSVEPKQYEELKKFKTSCQSRGLYETYSDINDFKSKFYRQLQLQLKQHDYFLDNKDNIGVISMDDELKIPDLPKLTREAQDLLKEASKDNDGNILRLEHLGGFSIQCNQREFISDNTPRTKAIWEDALQELENLGLIATDSYKRQIFHITREGYDIAEFISL